MTDAIESGNSNVKDGKSPFDRYPGGGRRPLGPCKRTDVCRANSGAPGYGEEVMLITGVHHCIYCGEDLSQSLTHWITFHRDHVVGLELCQLLGVPGRFYDDIANMACVCYACNIYDNHCGKALSIAIAHSPEAWTWEAFVVLRDKVYLERKARIQTKIRPIRARYESKPWKREGIPESDFDRVLNSAAEPAA